ncbi:hypothetical protein GCM10010452_23030 [Crossiella cryophila]|uniref:Uncharacterized protein n=1 Tax=Crossiella cryophila TaxID=43355 RepID=A0A7W7CFK3_9PSEU|nr:hypothetical protein [Crossiella cryophila]
MPPGSSTPAKLTALRRGELTFPRDAKDITLDQVRYVNDLAVSGVLDGIAFTARLPGF